MIPIPLSMDITAFFRSFSNSFDIIVSGYVISDVYNRSAIVGIVKWDLSSFIVHIHNRFYKQVSGIPQGSVLSYPLCNMYLRAFDKLYWDLHMVLLLFDLRMILFAYQMTGV